MDVNFASPQLLSSRAASWATTPQARGSTADSSHSHLLGWPAEEVVDGPAGAARFVTDRIAEGADYIKLIVDTPGPDQEIRMGLVDLFSTCRGITSRKKILDL
jgi:hypothetical protein